MLNYLYLMVCALFLCVTPVLSAEKSQTAFTQKDLAQMIVSHFAWSDGLPKEPADRDYLIILGGQRTFRYEAENAYNPKTDNVTVAEYSLYGRFSGKGWLLGVSEKTSANFTVQLPIGGVYSLKAAVKGDGFIWEVDGKEYKAGSTSGGFKEVDLGAMPVKPGVIKIKVTIPPQGGIDSFTFSAKDYNPIQPFTGWRFKEPLTTARLAEVGVSLMNIYHQLPEVKKDIPASVAAVDVALPTQDAMPTKINYLGAFKSHAWLRADFRGATIQLPIKVAETGIYGLWARALGQRLEGDVNGKAFVANGKPYLDMTELGLFRLDSGENMLTLKLPPMGGLDFIEFTRRGTSSLDFMNLVGLSGAPDRVISADEAKSFVKKISEKYPVRK
ncbi:MAG: hypothetical protein A2X79_02570 [Desulfuromonadaceae bacterium GWB2_53_15]|nr:MAG: hypothetical protein A2X83_01085 [Desulfuromonadales bacterium GWD2_54_10]OHB26004.1 MAG: hypothetical protein A2X79_02570 [Desulfuromonadaceae bacterium GWB2_53_15]